MSECLKEEDVLIILNILSGPSCIPEREARKLQEPRGKQHEIELATSTTYRIEQALSIQSKDRR